MLAVVFAVGVGIVIATVVGASESIVWRWSIGIAAVPAAIMLAPLLRLPESPRRLVRNDDRDGAAAVLRRVRPSGFDVDGELDEMADLARKEQKATGVGPGCASAGCGQRAAVRHRPRGPRLDRLRGGLPGGLHAVQRGWAAADGVAVADRVGDRSVTALRSTGRAPLPSTR
jgi:sugar transport protein